MSTIRQGITAYSASGSNDPSVRTRVISWAERTGLSLDLRVGGTVPSFGRAPDPGGTTLVFRNAVRMSRGRSERRVLDTIGLTVYELDDGLPWDTGRLEGLGKWWKVPFRRDRIANACASTADRVVAGNDVLADWASEFCADVRMIPTCIEPSDYERKSDYQLADTPTIAWLGSAATEFELAAIAPALREVHRRTGSRLHVIGAAASVLPSELGPITTRTPWSLAAQRTALAAADIGLMPVTDGVYQRAKCGYKLLQYAAAGLPAVASPVGVNASMLQQGLGSAAVSQDDWVQQISALLQASAQFRERAGTVAHDVAVDQYSYERWEPEWRRAMGIHTLSGVGDR